MKNMKTGLFAFIALVASVSLSLLTCEIGLGNSVDTKPPSVALTYPGASSVITGDFVVAGTVNDETGIGSVVLHVRSLSGTTLASFAADVNRSAGSWRANVANNRTFSSVTNEFTQPAFPDGKYILTAEATDNAGRKTSVDVAVSLDNSAPFLRMSQPTTTGATNPLGLLYGNKFVFKGDIWDAGLGGDVCQRVVLNFYDASGALITSYTELNPVGTLDVTIEDDPSVTTPAAGSKEAVYRALIAGMTNGGAETQRTIYYTATAYDYARTFTNPSVPGGTVSGNASPHYFLRNQLINLFINSSASPQLSELSYWDYDPALVIDASITRPAFRATRITGTVDPATFNVLNHTNFAVAPFNRSPKIDITGLEPSPGDYSDYSIAPKSNLSIKITLGPDGYEIDTDALRLRLIPKGSTPGANDLWVTKEDLEYLSLGSTLLVNYTVDETSGEFKLEIDAVDKANKAAWPSEWFFTVNDGVPTLDNVLPKSSVSDFDPVKIRPDGDGNFSITVTGRDKEALRLTVQETDSGGTPIGTALVSAALAESVVNGDGAERNLYTWNLTLPAKAEGVNFYLSFTLSDGPFKSGTLTRIYLTDTTAPVLASASISGTPLTLADAPLTRNAFSSEKALEITGYASADLAKVRFAYTATSAVPASPVWTETAVLSSPETNPAGLPAGTYKKFVARPQIAVNTGENEGTYYLWYGLADDTLDNGGNSVFTPIAMLGTVAYDKSPPEFGSTSLTLAAPVATQSFNVPLLTVNRLYTLSGTVTDTNGIASIVIERNGTVVQTVSNPATSAWSYAELDSTNGTNTYTITATDRAGKTASLTRYVVIDSTGPLLVVNNLSDGSAITTASYTITGSASDASGLSAAGVEYLLNGTLPWTTVSSSGISWSHLVSGLTEGASQSIQFRASDIAGNETVGPVINFGLDLSNPSLVVTNKATYNNTTQGAGFTLNGTAQDSNGIQAIEISMDYGSTWLAASTIAPALPITTNTVVNWSHPIALPGSDGLMSVRVRAIDTYNKITQDSLNVTFDSAGPVFSVANLANGQLVTANPYTISGTWTDNGGSGTVGGYAKMEYRVDGGTWASFASNASSWSGSVNLGAQSLTKIVDFRGTDYHGNQSPVTTLTFVLDTSLPVVTETTVGTTALVYRASGADLVLSGTASDGLGLNQVEVYASQNSGASTLVHTDNATPDAWTYTLTANPANDGTWAFIIVATDSAGRQSASLTRSVLMDSSAPTLTLSTPSVGQTGINAMSGDTLIFQGTSDDGTGVGVAKIMYAINNSATPPALGSFTDVATSGGNWNFTRTVPGDLSEGPGYYIHVLAEDLAGQQSAIISRAFDIDKSAPSVAETVAGAGSLKRSEDFTLGGTASDTSGLATWDHDANGGTAEVPYVDVSEDNGSSWLQVTVTAGNWTYNKTVAPDGSDDGEITFRIRATDLVGRQTEVSRTVMIDATAPDIDVDGVIAGLNVSTGDVNGLITMRFSASDSGSGLERVDIGGGVLRYRAYWTVVADGFAGSPSAADIATWTALDSTSSVFSFNYDTTAIVSGDRDVLIGIRDSVTGNPNGAFVKYDLSIDQASNRPDIVFDNMDDTAVLNSDNGFGQNPTILITVSDDDKVDVSDLEYRIDANNDGLFTGTYELGTPADKWENESIWYKVEEVPASDSSLAQGKIKLTGFPQGAFRVQVRARDYTDVSLWAAIYDVVGNYTWQKSAIIPFAVDYGPPSIAVTSPVGGIFNQDFTLAGSATDALEVLTARYTLDGGSTYTALTDTNGSATVFDFSSTVDVDVLASGEYVLQVEATDFGGTTAVQQIPITIDRTAPSVNLLQPGVGSLLNGTDVVVRGEASDNRQLGAVFVWHGLASALSTPPALPSRTGPGTYNAGGYSTVTGAGIWNTTINTTAVVDSGADGYAIRVVAVDAIGNVGTPVDYLFHADQESDRPLLGFSNLVESGPPSRLSLGNLSIIGTATDDDSVRGNSFQVRIDRNGDNVYSPVPGDNELWVPMYTGLPGNTYPSNALVVSWVYLIEGLTSEGLHHVQVRTLDTKDTAGDYSTGYNWNESASIPFYIDNGPPALELTAPSLGQRFNVDEFTITGTTSDTNGIAKVEIWVDDNENGIVNAGELTVIGWVDANANGAVDGGEGALTSDNTSYPINETITGLSNGVKTVRVTSFDTSLAQTVRELTVVIDTADPSAVISTPSNGNTINGTVQVIGTATDNYQVAQVYYSLRLTALPVPAFPADYTLLAGQTYAWNFNLNTTAFADGAYTLRVVVVDSAGNNSSTLPQSVAFNIDQATDRPVIDVLTLVETAVATDNLLPASLTVSGTISDDDSVDRTKIQVRSRVLGSGEPGWSTWSAISGAPASNSAFAIWSHTFTGFTDGKYEFQLRAADIYDANSAASQVWTAANTWSTILDPADGNVEFAVDTALPTGTIDAPAVGTFHRTNVAVNGASADANGIKRVTIAYDRGAGYAQQDGDPGEDTLYNDTNSADGYVLSYNWSDSYLVSNGNGQVYFRVSITDAFDKVRTIESNFTVDTLAPGVSIQLPASGSVVNGSVLSRGSTTDVNPVSAVWVKVTTNDVPGLWDVGADLAANGWTLLTGQTYSWEYRFRSIDFYAANSSDDPIYLHIVAIDGAGNRSNPNLPANKLSFAVNQSLNRPTVAITTPNNSILDNGGVITGTITDDDSVDSSTVMIDLGDGAGFVPVTTVSASGPNVTFSHSLAGLAQREAPYTVQVRAYDVGEDFAGTANDIPAVVSNIPSISIRKDDSNPSITITQIDNGLLTSPTLQGVYLRDSMVLSGEALDGVRVASVEARLVGVNAFGAIAVANTGTDFSTWTWTASGLTLAGSTVNLEVRVTDVNGRTVTTAYTLLVDTAVPSVVIDTPTLNPDAASGSYNGRITFRGTSADGVKVERVYYRWGTSASAQPNGTYAGWTLAGSTYSWTTAELNTNALYNDTADHTYYLSAVSVDAAGNESLVASRSFTINQTSDRPALTLSAPTAGAMLETNAKATGTITDDDGLSDIEIRIAPVSSWAYVNGTDDGYVNIGSPASPSGKSVNIEQVLSALTDGSYRLQIRAFDSNYGTGNATAYSFFEYPTVDFSINTASPTVVVDSLTVQALYSDQAVTPVTSGFNGTYVNNDFILDFTVTDNNGLRATDPVRVNIDGGSWATAALVGGNLYRATLNKSDFADGTRQINYSARDANNKETTGLITIIVDKTPPTISFTSPAGISSNIAVNAPNMNGTAVTVTGSVSDSSVITSTTVAGGSKALFLSNASLTNASATITPASMPDWLEDDDTVRFSGTTVPAPFAANTTYYVRDVTGTNFALAATSGGAAITVTNKGTLDYVLLENFGATTAITNNGNETSWSITFDTTAYDNATYSTETSGGSNIWRFPITITTRDLAGNRAYRTGFVDLDPNGDRPNVSISTPTADASVTGIVTLNGTVTDDDGTSGTVNITLETGTSLTGPWTPFVPAFPATLTGVTVTNGAWSAQINRPETTGAMSGYVRFTVTPFDVNGIQGDPLERAIFIDSSLPTISGYNGAEIAAPTPASGSRQSGIITIRALFKDDDVIPEANLQVSLDGGTTYVALSTQDGYVRNVLAEAGGKKRYDVSFDVNTATYAFAQPNTGNGSMSVILQITDNTYKPAVLSLSYTVDNRPPEGTWDLTPATLTPQGGRYSFFGSGSTNDNKLIGTAKDGGAVSGISYVDVFFVKGGNFLDPKFLTGEDPVTNAVLGDELYTRIAFTAGNISGSTFTIDRTTWGTVNNALPVRFIGTSLPAGLDENLLYYVQNVVGNAFTLSTDPSGANAVTLTGTGSGYLEYALTGVPYTSDAYTDSTASGHYAIRINTRTELGSNDDNANGDNDGFQESLKDKGGYDEWFAYFDTTELPDGPLDVYYVIYDENGNKMIGRVSGQITNRPPSVPSVNVNGSILSASPWKAKTAGNLVPIIITADDTAPGADISATGWKLEVVNRWGNGVDVAASAEGGFTGWKYGTESGSVRTFTTTGSGTTLPVTGTVNIDFDNDGAGADTGDGFMEGYWYEMVATVMDTDDNIATRTFFMRVLNNDIDAPVVTINPIDQTTVSMWTNKYTPLSLDVPAAALANGSAVFNVTLPSWIVNGSRVMFAGEAIPGTNFARNTVYYVRDKTGTSFSLAALPNGTAISVNAAPSGTYYLASAGHAEAAGDSNYSQGTADADVSGTIRLSGTVRDDTDVTELEVRIDGTVVATLTPANGLTNRTGDVINGYEYDWAYVWDTSRIATVAKADVAIVITGRDAAATSLDGTAPAMTVDVVPYITSITDATGLSADVLRGATGRYSIATSGTLTVRGHNLGRTGYAPAVRNSSTETNWAAGTLGAAPTLTSVNEIQVTKNWARSGYLTVVVNTTPSGNNLNNNTETVGNGGNNLETTADPRSAMWTDDRYLWVWAVSQVNITTVLGQDAANPANMTYYYPDMIIDPTDNITPLFTFGEINSGNLYRMTNSTTIQRRAGYRAPMSSGVAYTSNNGYFIITNMNVDQGAGANVGYLEVTNGADDREFSYGGTINWNRLEGLDYPLGTASRTFGRFKYPKILAENATTTGSNVFVTYYDGQIDRKDLNFVAYRSTARVVDNLADPANQAGKSTGVLSIPGTLGRASEYYDFVRVGTRPTAGIAVAYYDAVSENLKLAWSANAFTYDANGAVPNTGATWNTLATPIDSTVGAGKNVSMAISGSTIYVAYFDSSEADLKMTRITWDGSTTTPVVETPVYVDRYLSAGTWTKIELISSTNLTGIAGPVLPFISYYADSQQNTKKPIKVAFPKFNASTGTLLHGTTSDGADEEYSGDWECITIPAISIPKGGIEQFNRVNMRQRALGGMNVPIVGWLADKLEYGILQPNN